MRGTKIMIRTTIFSILVVLRRPTYRSNFATLSWHAHISVSLYFVCMALISLLCLVGSNQLPLIAAHPGTNNFKFRMLIEQRPVSRRAGRCKGSEFIQGLECLRPPLKKVSVQRVARMMSSREAESLYYFDIFFSV